MALEQALLLGSVKPLCFRVCFAGGLTLKSSRPVPSATRRVIISTARASWSQGVSRTASNEHLAGHSLRQGVMDPGRAVTEFGVP